MTHSMIERLAVLACIFAAAMMGYLIQGFAELGSFVGVVGCSVSVVLFAWSAWEILDV